MNSEDMTTLDESQLVKNEDVERGINTDVHLGKKISNYLKYGFERKLSILMIVFVLAGCICGCLLRLWKKKFTKREVMYVGYIGSLYYNMLMCTSFPLFVTSVITAFGNLDWKSSGKIALRILSFFAVTMLLAALVSAAVMLSFKPGRLVPKFASTSDVYAVYETTWNYVYDLIRNMFPANIVEACMFKLKTELILEAVHGDDEITVLVPVDVRIRATNYLGLIVVATAIGVSFSYMGSAVRICLIFTEAINTLCIDLTYLFLRFSPVGMFCLACSQILEFENLEQMLEEMGLAAVFVVVVQLIHALVVLPLLFFILTRKNAFRFYITFLPAIATAWATSSSIATIPVTLAVLEQYSGVSRFTARLVVPLGAQLNHNGGIVKQIVFPWYIAQNNRLPISKFQYFTAGIVAILVAVASPGVAGGSIAGLDLISSYLGIVTEDPANRTKMVEFFVDRSDTALNVLGDCLAAVYLEERSKKQLRHIGEAFDLNTVVIKRIVREGIMAPIRAFHFKKSPSVREVKVQSL